jgi:hypothetical protein
MNNTEIAMSIQCGHEDELDGILSDIDLVKRAAHLAQEEYQVSKDEAWSIGAEVLKIYGEVV